MAINEQFIFSWLSNVEGALTCVGYIPCKQGNFRGAPEQDPDDYTVLGVSGVTVGVGVDLGQQSWAQLQSWGVPDALLTKLRRYIGLKRDEAKRVLKLAPLTLSEEEARELTNAEHHGFLRDVTVPWWNAKGGIKFEDLPYQAQTVVFSLTYQCGCAGAQRRGPNTLKALLEGDWCRAAACLMDRNGWNGEYVNRRYQEGELVQELCK